MSFTTLALTVNSIAISHNTIKGPIAISRRENQAATMDIPLKPTTGLQDIDYWAGKSVSLVIDGTTVFIGKVDMPEVDVIGKQITLVCTDTRREILNDQTVSSVGFYSLAIFSEVENTIEELEQRLTTIPSVADILPNGTYAITSMLPKSTADFTLTNSDVFYRKPTVSPSSRLRLTNQVNLNFKLRYARKRHRERDFKITDLSFCDIIDLGGAGGFTFKKTLLNYANQMDWNLDESSITWEEMPSSAWITTCPSAPGGFAYIQDTRFATSITFTSATRFTQTVIENFNITVKAPQSITQYGVIDWNQDNSYDVQTDVSDWEKFPEYVAPSGGTVDSNDYYIDEDGLSADFDNAIETAINIANTKILSSHRDTQVTFETDLRLDFNLTHTIELSTDILDAKGKVSAIDHSIDVINKFTTTTTEISLSTAQGAQVADSLTVPTRPTVPVVADAWTSPQVMPIATGTVDTPAIDDTSRDEQVVDQAVTYDIEIENNTFGVTF